MFKKNSKALVYLDRVYTKYKVIIKLLKENIKFTIKLYIKLYIKRATIEFVLVIKRKRDNEANELKIILYIRT